MPRISQAGLTFEETNLSKIGVSDQGFHLISREGVANFFGNLDALVGLPGDPFSVEPDALSGLHDQQFNREHNIAAYVQGRIDIGKLEIIGGLRFNRTKSRIANVVNPFVTTANGVRDLDYEVELTTLLEESAVKTDILPRFQFNYRQTDNLIFRGSYALSIAHPSIFALSNQKIFTLNLAPDGGPNFDQPTLEIREGNAELKPSTTHNFDIDVEYYHDQIGLIKIGGFYKHINNLLESVRTEGFTDLSNIEYPDDSHLAGEGRDYFSGQLQDLIASGDIFVTGNHPENSPFSASVWGLEAHIERQLTFLPGFWNGFGVYANYSYSKSSRHNTQFWSGRPVVDPDTGEFIVVPGDFLGFDEFFNPIFGPSGIRRESVELEADNTRLGNQSSGTGTVALTYNKHDIDATLAYGFQGRTQNGFNGHNLNSFNEGVGTLDFRIAYYFNVEGGRYRLYFEAQDLLKGTHSPDLEKTQGGVGNVPKYYTGARYLGGRKLRLGLTATF